MTKEIYFAGGCFWGTEHFMKQIVGVVSTQVGYANSEVENPSYSMVCAGKTHAVETVRVIYDEGKVDLNFLVGLYFQMIDPTSLNKQGEDEGTQYRTGIYYTDEVDASILNVSLQNLAQNYALPIRVELLPLKNFYVAEDYHQDYLEKHPDGYCHVDLSLFAMARKAAPNNK